MIHEEKIFVLIDINNCYVWCERFFSPKLNNVLVIVLLNNNGCAVARSNEVKAMGIKMSLHFFKSKMLSRKIIFKFLQVTMRYMLRCHVDFIHFLPVISHHPNSRFIELMSVFQIYQVLSIIIILVIDYRQGMHERIQQ